MLNELQYREKTGSPIRVGLIGAGSMGTGIAWQIGRTPGMRLAFIAATTMESVQRAQIAYGKETKLYSNADQALDDPNIEFDVLVDATSTIGISARYALKAIHRKAHVVLLNAHVDLFLGFYLQHEAAKHGVIVTSDAGDQHGVLARMIEELQLWGFQITQAGNIKGFLDRHSTADSKREIAKKLNLKVVPCVAYSDGTKVNIEMALIANGTNLIPTKPGMEGPVAKHVSEAVNLFDFDAYGEKGRVDYILGAQPGGGVYVIGKCEDRLQESYLNYYKVHNRYPYYVFYRPYHLCHLETPRAVALAALWNKPVLRPTYGRLTDVYAYAKQPLKTGDLFADGIGGDGAYGLIHEAESADQANYLPIGLLEAEETHEKPRVLHDLERDQPIRWSDVELPDTELLRLYRIQQKLLKTEVVTV
ncbi:homoserine dehydrogenase [Coxiella burnetii]|uniref:homoserine dehydrogenase n=1 Tax=Coxiella burnetii TaxID=777 RepID=UPI000183D031|nr:homoserine dehydrogenase [Coxiella burnetii]ACJ17655.1 homoserine dehydrogenase [Coxiella burnetii CbuG_Q212]ATN66108.1 homoserine dehydrogenase [Coxiella burnetii]OYK86934.1 homoserine dehydrogenase [Coxiella burnetii]